MIKRIEPDSFARLMKLPFSTRTDLLEFIGQSPSEVEEIVRRAANMPHRPTECSDTDQPSED